MAGLLDLHRNPGADVLTAPLPTVPRGDVERFELEWAAARAPDRSYFYRRRLHELYDQVIERAAQVTGQVFDNPADYPDVASPTADGWRGPGYEALSRQGPLRADKHRELVEGLKSARRLLPELADPDTFNAQVAREAQRLREQAAAAEGLGGGLGAFTGGVAGEMSHPLVAGVTVLTLPIGGGGGAAVGLSRGILAGAARPMLANAARAAGIEAGISGLTEALVQVADAETQGALGTDPGFDARAGAVAEAAIGGALFGASIRALADSFRLLRGEGRTTQAERDALAVADQQVLDQQTRPAGGAAVQATHEANARAATEAVAKGEAPPEPLPAPAAESRARAAERAEPATAPSADKALLDRVKTGLRQGQQGLSMDELYAQAPAAQENLAEAGRELAATTGARFKDPGIKKRPTSEEKMLRKGYADAGRLTDVVRGGFLVDSVAQADAIVEGLARRFALVDEGWEVTSAGYFDRKIMLRFESGLVGEVQMWAEPILEAKLGRGTELYNEMRSLPPGDPRLPELQAESVAVYSAAVARLSDDFRVLARGGGGQASPAAAITASSEARRPSNISSAESISNQPDSRSTQTDLPRSTQTAGSPSTSKNSRGIDDTSSPLNVAAAASGRNARGVVFTPAGRRIEVEYQLVDDAALIASHSAEGKVNRLYPAELQPRQRERAASQAQIAEIAGQLQPERLGRSSEAGTGAPIVGRDGAVESGNGRLLALRRAYDEGLPGAERYRSWLRSLGYDPSGVARPILIARRTTPLTPAERLAFAREANEAVTASMSSGEQARADRGRVLEALELAAGGELEAAANRAFVQAFVARLPKEERAGLLTADGAIAPEGLRRVQAAAVAAAYDDPAFVARLVEGGDEAMRGIGDVLRRVALDWARLRWQAREGLIPAELDVTADLRQAIATVERARQAREKIADHIGQLDAFSDLTPAARQLIPFFFTPDLARQANKTAIERRLRGYLDEAAKIQPGANLFGQAAPSADEVLGALSSREQQQAAGLFAARAERHEALRQEAARAEEGELTDALELEARRLVEQRPEATMPVALEEGEAPTMRLVSEVLDEADDEIQAAETALDCAIRTTEP